MEHQETINDSAEGGVEPLWGIRDVARYLRVSDNRTIRRYIRNEGLPAHKLAGGKSPLVFIPSEVQEWVRIRCFTPDANGAAA